MPITFRILPDIRLVHVRCSGVITLEEILRHEGEVVADPGFDAEYDEIFDLRSVDRLDLRHGDVAKIVGYEKSHDKYAGKRKVAFIAPADLEYGLGRMYEMMEGDSPMETRIFRDPALACEWLGQEPSDLKRE